MLTLVSAAAAPSQRTDERRRMRTAALWRQWHAARDEQTRARLVESLLGVAGAACAKRLRGLPPHADADDMASAAYLALIGAIERYDPSRGTPLEAFVWRRCDGAVLDWVRQEAPGTRRHRHARPGTLDEQAEQVAGEDPR